MNTKDALDKVLTEMENLSPEQLRGELDSHSGGLRLEYLDLRHPDDIAVDNFAEAMKAKMAISREKGRGGWNDPGQCTSNDLRAMLWGHMQKGDPVDVANFCMMLWHRGEGTV